jgi:phospholipid-binding lipoprotein MlaA
VLQLVNVRAELLATTQLLSDVSLDKYSFVRDGYLARRLDQVYDGNPPLEKFEDEAPTDPPRRGTEARGEPRGPRSAALKALRGRDAARIAKGRT